MTLQTAPAISTVNYHLWKPCNMRCQFCFATFVDISKEVERCAEGEAQGPVDSKCRPRTGHPSGHGEEIHAG